jgi:AcrR family transcriptional regulator
MEPNRPRILAAALDLGEQRGLHAVHLHDIAKTAGVTLVEIRRHFPDKDVLTEAWFDQADDALLRTSERPGWDACSPRQRLHHALFARLQVLAPHRVLTAEMLRYKLQPEHLQALGVMRVSRTVQWIREVAMLPTIGWRRGRGEEAVLTAIYLTTFARWLIDDSPASARTHAVLDRLLAAAERRAVAGVPRVSRGPCHPCLARRHGHSCRCAASWRTLAPA